MAQVPSIEVGQLRQRLKAEPAPFLLDVREPWEYRDGHVPGAQLIPLGELEQRVNEVPRDRPIWPSATAASGVSPRLGTSSNSATPRSATSTAAPPPGSSAATRWTASRFFGSRRSLRQTAVAECPHHRRMDGHVILRRTYRYRIYPTARQRLALEAQLRFACELYNAALEQRRDAWRSQRRALNYVTQCRELTDVRAAGLGPVQMNCTAMRDPLRRLDRAFAAFFRRVKARTNPGYPRFRASRRYDSLTWADDGPSWTDA